MQVILSTAIDETDPYDEKRNELLVVTNHEASASSTASVIRSEVGKLYSVKTTLLSQLHGASEDSSYLVIGTDQWMRSDCEEMANRIRKSKGALLVRRADSNPYGFDPVDDVQSLHAIHPSPSIVSIAVDSKLDIFGRITAVALSNLLKTIPEKRDKHYVLSSNQLETYRVVPFSLSPGRHGQEMSKTDVLLKSGGQYVVRGVSVCLITATCELLASLGARNIWVVLGAASSEYEKDLERLQPLAAAMREIRVAITVVGEEPSFSSKIAGIIDFGDVQEVWPNPNVFPSFSLYLLNGKLTGYTE